MKFYVAARWEDFEMAQKVCDDLESRGHICTHNWMKIAKAVETEDLIEDLSVSAPDDLHGVQNADMFILIARGAGGQGRWVEMGVALDRLLPIKAGVINIQRSVSSFTYPTYSSSTPTRI